MVPQIVVTTEFLVAVDANIIIPKADLAAAFEAYINSGQLARDFDKFASSYPSVCDYAEPIDVRLASTLSCFA